MQDKETLTPEQVERRKTVTAGVGAKAADIIEHLRATYPNYRTLKGIMEATGATNRESTINTLSRLSRQGILQRGAPGAYRIVPPEAEMPMTEPEMPRPENTVREAEKVGRPSEGEQ